MVGLGLVWVEIIPAFFEGTVDFGEDSGRGDSGFLKDAEHVMGAAEGIGHSHKLGLLSLI